LIEEFRSYNSRDFRQRYLSSFGFFTTESGKRVLVRMESVEDQRVSFKDKDGVNYVAHADVGVVFEFIPVSKRLYMKGKDLVFIRRRPARQWSRGINQANTQVTVLGRGEVGVDFAYVDASLSPPLINIKAEVERLERKETYALALSDMFGVVGQDLYVYGENIGVWSADRREIVLDEPVFRQEILDLLARNEINYKVLPNG
jgi:hypothetical protein